MRFSRAVCAVFAILFTLSCTDNKELHQQLSKNSTNDLTAPAPVEPRTFADNWEKQIWMNKVAQDLRYGIGLCRRDPLPELLKMNSLEIVDYFLKDPLFAETVLDFNMYFLGFKVDQLRVKETRAGFTDIYYAPQVFDTPSAVASAQEILKDGNYLKLLEYQQPLYMRPLWRVYPDEKGNPRTRQQVFSQMDSALAKAIQLGEEATPDKIKICEFADQMFNGYYEVGFHNLLINQITQSENNYIYDYFKYCFGRNFPLANFIDSMKKQAALMPKIWELIQILEPDAYPNRTVADIKSVDPEILIGKPTSMTMFRNNFWRNFQNSSTNMNRKRGAYILKQFFCDDLTPIDIVIPENHTGGRHGDEPSCYACHYKLDPMSGFFRYKGDKGRSFKDSSYILFDDRADRDSQSYFAHWKAPANSGREWNVGYVRSLQFPENNVYGDDLPDLFRLIQTAPEVKACLVKKMFRYFVSENQNVDRGYLQFLSEEFIEGAKQNSSLALKQTIRRIVHSNAYSQNDAVDTQCYDYRPGENPAGKPPCKVSYLLEKHCASCHQGDSAAKGLDLTKWIKIETAWTFPHKKLDGTQETPKETFRKISERLATANQNLRMPLKRFISPQDQEQIYLWIEEVRRAQ